MRGLLFKEMAKQNTPATPVPPITPLTPEESLLKATETILKLQGQLSQSEKEYTQKIAQLEQKNREQAVEIDNKDDVIDELKKANQEQEALIAELTAAVDQQDNNGLFVSQTPVVEHEGEKYEVAAKKFSLDGTEYTLSDLTEPALVARLIARQSGVLRKIA